MGSISIIVICVLILLFVFFYVLMTAEKDDDEGNKMMAKLGEEFDKTYRQFAATALDLHD